MEGEIPKAERREAVRNIETCWLCTESTDVTASSSLGYLALLGHKTIRLLCFFYVCIKNITEPQPPLCSVQAQ